MLYLCRLRSFVYFLLLGLLKAEMLEVAVGLVVFKGLFVTLDT